MFAQERQYRISTLVSADGRVTVTGLSSRFGVTQETVRRDLAPLEDDGVLRRVERAGGHVRALTSAYVGSSTVAHVARLRADVAFVGTNGIAAGFGLSTPDVDEAAVKTAVVRSARRVVLLADSSKFDEEILISFATLEDIDVLITDRAPRGALAEALADVAVTGA